MIAFIGGQRGQGWHIFIITDDGTDIRRLTEDLPPGRILFTPLWSPDGKLLAFTYKERVNTPTSQVCTIHVESKEVQFLTPPEGMNFAKQWLSSGIVYQSTIMHPPETESSICAMLDDGSEKRCLYTYARFHSGKPSAESFHNVAVSPDGKKIAMVSWDDEQLYLITEGSNPVALTKEGLRIQRVAWTSESSMLAFSTVHSKTSAYEDLHIICVDRTDQKQVGRVLRESEFNWSPDNKHIATVGFHKQEFPINVIDTRSLVSRRIATVEDDPEGEDLPNCPIWSPDGQSLLYTTFANPFVHIYLAEIATGKIDRILGDEGEFRYLSYPTWT
jgi:Tol biopolymer transport system component